MIHFLYFELIGAEFDEKYQEWKTWFEDREMLFTMMEMEPYGSDYTVQFTIRFEDQKEAALFRMFFGGDYVAQS
jgi:hypothetical protein